MRGNGGENPLLVRLVFVADAGRHLTDRRARLRVRVPSAGVSGRHSWASGRARSYQRALRDNKGIACGNGATEGRQRSEGGSHGRARAGTGRRVRCERHGRLATRPPSPVAYFPRSTGSCRRSTSSSEPPTGTLLAARLPAPALAAGVGTVLLTPASSASPPSAASRPRAALCRGPALSGQDRNEQRPRHTLDCAGHAPRSR